MAELRAAELSASRLGYDFLKTEQKAVISAVLKGQDVFAVLPTGYGKSLCFTVLPWAYDVLDITTCGRSIIVIVSPLKALLENQALNNERRGLPTAYISDDTKDDCVMMNGVLKGEFQVVYFTPESLLNNRKWRRMLNSPIYEERLRTIVFDEAHCIDTWGSTFREVFLRVGELRSLVHPKVNVLAMTATITRFSRLTVQNVIGMKSPLLVSLSPCNMKSHLSIVKCKSNSLYDIFDSMITKIIRLRISMPRTIIFCRTIDDCSVLYHFFKYELKQDWLEPRDAPDVSQFRLVDMFHRYTEGSVKSNIIESFTNVVNSSPLRLVICTVAFGMGIDCSNVQEVIHFNPPDTNYSYIQEIGRCGRNSLSCKATLLLKKRLPKTLDFKMKTYISNTLECRRNLLFDGMEGYEEIHKCYNCDICC